MDDRVMVDGMEVFDGVDVGCPRRIEAPYIARAFPFPDVWIDKMGRTCSYCGSMHPEDFIAALKNGIALGVTYMPYKAYLDLPNFTKFYYQHLSDEQMNEFIGLLNDKKIVFQGGVRFTVLPYFMMWK